MIPEQGTWNVYVCMWAASSVQSNVAKDCMHLQIHTYMCRYSQWQSTSRKYTQHSSNWPNLITYTLTYIHKYIHTHNHSVNPSQEHWHSHLPVHCLGTYIHTYIHTQILTVTTHPNNIDTAIFQFTALALHTYIYTHIHSHANTHSDNPSQENRHSHLPIDCLDIASCPANCCCGTTDTVCSTDRHAKFGEEKHLCMHACMCVCSTAHAVCGTNLHAKFGEEKHLCMHACMYVCVYAALYMQCVALICTPSLEKRKTRVYVHV